jgi:hypothetical protein
VSDQNAGAALAKPRFDGNRVIFEIDADGRRVPCVISRSALQGISQRRHFASGDLLRSFNDARRQIEQIALRKYRAQPESASGVTSIWEEDVEDTRPSSDSQAVPPKS